MILRHPERDRGRARLEIIADRRGDDEELIFGRRFDTEKHLAREHEGAEVQRAAVEGREPAGIGGDGFLHRRDEHLRSEEHTSELQSLMRNSYAVFCLQKKKNITPELIKITISHIQPL